MPVLHRTQNANALMPRFVQRFRCIGPQCEDTCCAGWGVHIDKKTYKAYRKDAPAALENLARNLVRVDGASDDARYAVINPVGPGRQCPALQDGLCGVQARLGESYLSNLCHSYPRTNRRLNGQLEQLITLSCPEAARLALLAEDAFEFVEAPVQLREAGLLELNMRFGMAPQVMADIRIFCMNLVRTRELAMWQRLALLGSFCDALTLLCIQKKQAGIPAMIDDFVRLIEQGELLATLDPVQPNHEAQAMVFATLWAAKGFTPESAHQQDMLEQIAARFGADASGQVSAQGLVAAYRHGLCRLEEALTRAPWLIENYLLNELFVLPVPFDGDHPYDSYLGLMARYGLLRLLLAIQCNTDGELPSPELLAATVQLQCRRFQHDPGHAGRTRQALYESGWAELGKLYSLIRT